MEELLTTKEVAAKLKISFSTMRVLMKQRKIPFLKIGHSVRFRPSDVNQWVRAKSLKGTGKSIGTILSKRDK